MIGGRVPLLPREGVRAVVIEWILKGSRTISHFPKHASVCWGLILPSPRALKEWLLRQEDREQDAFSARVAGARRVFAEGRER